MSSWKWMAAMVLGGWLSSGGLLAQVGEASPSPAAGQGSETVSGTGKVLFSRSDDDPKTETTSKQDSSATAIPAAVSATTAEERDSLTFVSYDLDVRLVPKQESMAVRARLTLRNDGAKPLRRIALQLSSTLKWEQIRIAGGNAVFTQHLLDSDADHTGAVNEAVVTLAHELALKEELKLEVLYSGRVSLTAERLMRIGAPAQVAEKSDWDQISADFIGLRGFGNVVWYPVSGSPALLGDGAKLFAEIGRQKLRQQMARVALTVTSEFTGDSEAPNLAVLNGQVVAVLQTAAPENSYPGVVTASLPETRLGFAVPSFFLLARKKVDGGGVQVFATPDDLVSAQAYVAAVGETTPFVQQWLGAKPKSALTVVGLADPNNAATEEGVVFFTGLKASTPPKELEDEIVPALAHAYFQSPRVWLDEGVAQFLGSLWLEQTRGRRAALESLQSARGALAMAEPGSPGEAGGQDLIDASDTVYYRTKATYVLWMLRDLAGDAGLAAALRGYAAADDTSPEYLERLVEKASGKDLKWFFDAWVYHDGGLPEISITGVFPSRSAQAGQWLVAIELANTGYTDAEVPVTLRSNDTTMTERLRVPARGTVSRRMLMGSVPTEVQVNDGTVPEVADSIHVRKLGGDEPR